MILEITVFLCSCRKPRTPNMVLLPLALQNKIVIISHNFFEYVNFKQNLSGRPLFFNDFISYFCSSHLNTIDKTVRPIAANRSKMKQKEPSVDHDRTESNIYYNNRQAMIGFINSIRNGSSGNPSSPSTTLPHSHLGIRSKSNASS